MHSAAAAALGSAIAKAGLTLVYGGGGRGLMGIVSRAAKESEGEVIGIIPSFLVELEKPPHDGSKLIITKDMHELACTRFRRYRVRCFTGTGGGSWRGGSSRASSSLRLCG